MAPTPPARRAQAAALIAFSIVVALIVVGVRLATRPDSAAGSAAPSASAGAASEPGPRTGAVRTARTSLASPETPDAGQGTGTDAGPGPTTVSDFVDGGGELARVRTRLPDGGELVRTYAADGRPWEEYTLRDGRLHGPARTWYEEGGLSELITYRDGERDGPYELYHPEGTLAMAGAYAADEKTGTWRHWYADGQPESQLEYGADGKLSGTCTFWTSDGAVDERLSGVYEAGLKVRVN